MTNYSPGYTNPWNRIRLCSQYAPRHLYSSSEIAPIHKQLRDPDQVPRGRNPTHHGRRPELEGHRGLDRLKMVRDQMLGAVILCSGCAGGHVFQLGSVTQA
jgi:hypothetical protein